MTEIVLHGKDLVFEKSPLKKILNKVSIAIKKGDRLVIIGPNGAGKSTLLQLLSGIIQPKSGSIFLFGRMISSFSPFERARLIAVVGQQDRPDHRLKVWDYVSLGRIPHGMFRSSLEEKKIIENALCITNLSDLCDREMESLSGGEHQRAQIARAIAQQPRILFLDEPTNHLDPQARGTLLTLITKLDLTVVTVLHDLHLVPEFATDIAILKEGRLVSYISARQTLDPSVIRDVFGIDLFYVPHPHEKQRMLTFFDIPF